MLLRLSRVFRMKTLLIMAIAIAVGLLVVAIISGSTEVTAHISTGLTGETLQTEALGADGQVRTRGRKWEEIPLPFCSESIYTPGLVVTITPTPITPDKNGNLPNVDDEGCKIRKDRQVNRQQSSKKGMPSIPGYRADEIDLSILRATSGSGAPGTVYVLEQYHNVPK